MDLKYYKQYYCKDIENVENFEKALADNFKNWCCHHRKGEFIPAKELIALGQYYNMPSDELIFLTESEHDSLHTKGKKLSEEHKKKIGEGNKGKQRSEEAKKKLSESRKGKHHTEETKKKISEAEKGKHISDETKKKISDAKKGKPGKPLSEETKKKIGEKSKGNTACRGLHWYNNSEIEIKAKECPDGFTPGRLKK